jgi:hypothetical protein
MAKKKPAVKMPAKKQVAKTVAKKPVKAAPKKEVKMAKKAPAKKAAPAKKVAPKKVEKKVAKPAAKPVKESFLKSASKLVAKVLPKGLSKDQIKKQKDKEAKEKKVLEAKEKTLSAKDKNKAESDKKKSKDQEKKDKENAKLQAKKDKENAKLQAKQDKEDAKNVGKKAKGKSKFSDEEDEDGDIELGPDDEPAFGEDDGKRRAKPEDDDVDEFEEDYKKSKAVKKTGKKAYEEDDVHVEAFTPKLSKKYQNAILADLESKIADEIAELREHFNWKDIAESIGTMDFFIDPKNDECIEKGCDNIRTTQSYCRLHYIRNQKTIQKKREILKEGKLQEYIEELISKYPVKYIDALLSDLSDDKEFYKVLNELNITSEFDFEEDELENLADDDDDDGDIGIETISSSLRYEDE